MSMIGQQSNMEIHDAPSVVHGRHVEVLSAIGQPAVELVVWQRCVPDQLHVWLETLELHDWPALRLLITPPDLPDALSLFLRERGLAMTAASIILVQDIQALATQYARIVGSERIEVRLEAINHDACWKFHRDCVAARLLTTYRGPATEWVVPAHASRALQEQKAYSGPLEQLRSYHVALFKGSCAGSGSGIVHRSPAMSGCDDTRLLLCLNQPSVTSPPAWAG